MLKIILGHGYGNSIKIRAMVDETEYIIEKDWLIAYLEKQATERGYTTAKPGKQMKYERLIIND